MISLFQNVLINHYLPFPKIIAPLKPKPLPLAAKYGGAEDAVEINRKSVVDEYFGQKKAMAERKTKQESIEKETRKITETVKKSNKQQTKGKTIGTAGGNVGRINIKPYGK